MAGRNWLQKWQRTKLAVVFNESLPKVSSCLKVVCKNIDETDTDMQTHAAELGSNLDKNYGGCLTTNCE